jgi:hypothetical protein
LRNAAHYTFMIIDAPTRLLAAATNPLRSDVLAVHTVYSQTASTIFASSAHFVNRYAILC